MNDNERLICEPYSTLQFMAADNARPSTSIEGHSLRQNVSKMMMVDKQDNEFNIVPKQKLDIDGKSDDRAKRLRLTLADPPQVGRNSDVTIGNRLLEEDTGRIIQTTLFNDNETYQTTSAVRKTLHGTVYQWKHMMLVVHRARQKGYSFRFATEMDAAEKFDDAVLEYQDNVRGRVHRFLQFKHLSVDGMVNADDLLKTAKNAPFGIVKYFNSWRKIRNNPIFNASRSKEFILCTNIGLDVVKLKANNIKVNELPMDDLLKVTIGLKQTPRFYNFVNEPSILRDKLEKEAGASKVEVSDFFAEFILAVDQPNEMELGKMIKHELGACHQFNLLNVHFIGACFQNKMVTLLKQTKRHSKFLSDQDADNFFEELQRQLSSLITVGLKLSYSAELKNYDIKFEAINSDLRKFLDSSYPGRNSILELTSSNPTLLTALRVYQTLEELEAYKKMDSLIFIDLEKLLLPDITDQVLCAFGSSISHDLLIIDCGLISNNEDMQTLWNRLRDILKEIPRKKLILIIQKNDRSAVCEIRNNQDDDITIIDLEKCSRQKLLEKNIIKFQRQDKRTSFGKIFGVHDFDNIESNKLSALNKIINPDTLIQLIRGEEILIGRKIPGLGKVEKYYIPRTIVKHVVIKAKILEDFNIPDLFTISGIDQEALEKLVATENGNQLFHTCGPRKLDPKKIHFLENGREMDHFKDICEQNSSRNIHWLQGESGKLLWYQSYGSITNLIAFKNTSIDYDEHEIPGAICLTENQLALHEEERRIVIISDTAGMGKSTLLTRLAGKMKDDQPSLLIIKIDLTEHTGVLDEERKKRTFDGNDTNGAVDFLVDKLSNLDTEFERQISKQIIKMTGETAVLIDGYDEICPDYGHVVVDLLETLAKLRIKRLFVTTRPHTSDVLERKLDTFSYILRPFSRTDQMTFLTKFWCMELNSNDSYETIEENLKQHATAVLEILVKLINPQMQEFTGIPLQTRLVAEAFPYEEKEKLKRFDSSEEPIYITDLYRCFVDKKFDILFKEKSAGDNTNLEQKKYRKNNYRIFLMRHQKLALEALFDEKTVTALMKCQRNMDEMSSSSQDEEYQDEGEERSGIVTQVISGKPHFVHRTFAEYFAAKFLIRKLNDDGCDSQVRKFFVAELLVDPRYEAIRAFLNCLLCCRDHTPEKDYWEFNLRENCNGRGRTLYHVAAKERNIGIVRFFSIRLCKNREDRTPHNVTESCNVAESVISPVKKSPMQNPDINLRDINDITPLLIAAGTCVLDLLKCFVERGADVNLQSQRGLTALHWALIRGAQLNVVKYLVEEGADVNLKSKDGLTALQFALSGGSQLDIVEYLVEKGADINCQSEDGSTALHSVLSRSTQLDIVKYLVEKGVDVNLKSKGGLEPLRCAALWGNQLDVVKYLTEKGAKITGGFGDGSIARHRAFWSCVRSNIEKKLFESGVKFNCIPEDSSIPNKDIVKFIIDAKAIDYED